MSRINLDPAEEVAARLLYAALTRPRELNLDNAWEEITCRADVSQAALLAALQIGRNGLDEDEPAELVDAWLHEMSR